jgi:DNA-binding response OmpR family regulator
VNRHIIEILLVEDNPNDVELTLHAFDKHKLANAIHVARDGQEALDWLAGIDTEDGGNPRPKVVMLDLKLPKVDGLSVLREIRANPALRTLPVVMMTSSREERDIVESYDLGVNSYLVKPIDFDKFVDTVQALGLYWVLLNEPPPRTAAQSVP